MEKALIVHGWYRGQTFIPDGPLPEAEGTAELVITPSAIDRVGSIVDAFGKATVLRSTEEILTQMREDREEWGDR